LIQDFELHLLLGQLGSNLAQVERRAGQSVKLGDQERVAFPHKVETGLQLWTIIIGTAALLLVDLLTVLQLL